MRVRNQKAEDDFIKSSESLSKVLTDKRLGRRGLVFGTLENVAKQYGVKIIDLGTYRVFSAPKNRLQVFAEKLHFSCTDFFN